MAASAVTTTSRTACEPFSRQLSRHSGNTSTVSSANVNITTIWPMTSSTRRSGAFRQDRPEDQRLQRQPQRLATVMRAQVGAEVEMPLGDAARFQHAVAEAEHQP